MEELPFDVEIEILLRLQVQPLRRLELVSKQWRSLIRSRDFMERYLVHQKSKHRFTILAGVKVMDPFAHEVFREPRFIRYFHSSDGDPGFSYMLLQNNEGVPCLSCDGFICCPRPVNHQFSNLPCSSLLGFGRDRVSGDYKLVRLFEPPGENTLCTGCELFSLKARKWIYISHVPIPCFNGQPSASVNGSIYWFTAYLWLTDADQYSTTAKIIAFDLHTHRFRAVHHPPTEFIS
ncbi:PREDICTED: F-box/LRR-repeat protein At2g43260-like [Camelina sativa]|uniref:F-box/LRR-repeat protein At2g43260-like n=1 Tax=Camelina sativa TaxID=90675 RepID=A0ABM0V5H0_CAMSA|nr:PREDICTED: F-box/LRR-repeat protein At2g43260-like [Camelina sativa]